MPKLLIRESSEKEKPVLCIYTSEQNFSIPLISHYQNNFKVLVISDKKPAIKNPHYFIPLQIIEKVSTVSKDISYGLFYLSREDDKKPVDFLTKTLLKETSSPIVFLIPVRDVQKFIDLILKCANNSRISFLLVGDLYSRLTEIDSQVSKILTRIKTQKAFELEGNDLEALFPISLEDAITGISSILFSYRRKSNLHFLFYKHPQSVGTLIHLLARIEPEIKIDIKNPDAKIQRYTTRDEVELYLTQKLSKSPQYIPAIANNFEQTIVSFFESDTSVISQPSSDDKKRTPSTIRTRIKPHAKKLALVSFISFCILTVLSIASIAGIIISTQKIERAIREKNFGDLVKHTKFFSKVLNHADPPIRIGLKIATLFPFGDRLEQQYYFAYDSIRLGERIINVTERTGNIKSGLSLSDLDSLESDITYSYFQAQKLINTYQAHGSETLTTVSSYLTTLPLLKKVLGYEGEKTYLLLFQNNYELRPTGGFIGSIGELTIRDGKVTEFKIEDVYELDGQLTKHVEPHHIIRRYLQPHLYLRDSNFEISFEESAKKSAQLYALESGKTVDGVFAVNYEVLARILGITGELRLENFDMDINQESAFELIQNTIHKDFFPGSTQKKDVLSSIYQQVALSLEEHPEKTQAILLLFPQLIQEKHILFAFQDPSVQKLMSSLNFSYDLADYRIVERKTLQDFLLINEANIGSSKVNQNIEREIKYTLDLQTPEPTGTLTLSYTNSSEKDDYKAYIRVALPYKSEITAVSIDEKTIPVVPAITDFRVYENSRFQPPDGIELDNVFLYDRQLFGFVVTVPRGKSQNITLSLQSSLQPRYTGVIGYSLLYMKQPGTKPYPFTLKLVYPAQYKSETPASSFGENSLIITDTLSTDKEFQIKLLTK